jgi:glycosyltransferase involved in cell wall biosynthesis
MNSKISIAYVAESLGPGGAERQMVELIKHLNKGVFDARVLVYAPGDFFRPELEALGISVHNVSRKGKWDMRPAMELSCWLRAGQVHLVHAYLNTANLYAVLARRLAGRGCIVASERCVSEHYSGLSRLHRVWSYRQADRVIANSLTAQAQLVSEVRLPAAKVLFIPNGVDMQRFSPVDRAARLRLRSELGWPSDRLVMLTVASFKAQKNHLGMLDALSGFAAENSSFVFYWVGNIGNSNIIAKVREGIACLNLNDVVRILEPQRGIADLYRACDVVILNSLWEGTPNVVLEAMACGRPVIATDVSDVSQYILPGQTGWLIPAADPSALRRALKEIACTKLERLTEMGAIGRQHLVALRMDAPTSARRHEELYMELCDNCHL